MKPSRAPGETLARVRVTSGEFQELFRTLSTWGRWGEDDERGALNLLGSEQLVAAVRLVREGTCVTLSLPLNTRAGPDNPEPAVLGAACESDGRWEFLFVAAPLRIPGGTGSPVNPLAIL